MSGILFALAVVAFAVVAYWTYQNDRAGPEAGLKGLLRMKAEPKAVGTAPEAPKWSGVGRRTAAASRFDKKPVSARQPKWRRKAKRPV